MTIDRETRHGGEEQDDEQQQEQSGVVYLDWQVYHEGQEGAQRVGDVLEVEVIDGTQEHDQGELVLHQEDGTSVFDRNELRGFRAQAGVAVPQYPRPERGEADPDEVEDGA